MTASIFHPPVNWEPMPRSAREAFYREPTSYRGRLYDTRFIPPIQSAIDRGEIEVKFVIKNHRYPDPRNQYYWRTKQLHGFHVKNILKELGAGL